MTRKDALAELIAKVTHDPRPIRVYPRIPSPRAACHTAPQGVSCGVEANKGTTRMPVVTYKAGHHIHGPNGMGYTITRDVGFADPITVDLFKPFGGAPEPVAGEQMPLFVIRFLQGKDIGDHPMIEVA